MSDVSRVVEVHSHPRQGQGALEYTSDFGTRSAASLVREGANVVVLRTFDKIHGLADMPIGYVLASHWLADALRKEGAGDAEGLGRLNRWRRPPPSQTQRR
jgi:hypothetical protein